MWPIVAFCQVLLLKLSLPPIIQYNISFCLLLAYTSKLSVKMYILKVQKSNGDVFKSKKSLLLLVDNLIIFVKWPSM